MGVYKVQAELPYQSGLPEDLAINVFYFVTEAADPDTTEMDSIVTRLTAFYNSTPAGASAGFSISDFIGIQVSRTANQDRFAFYWSPTIDPVSTPWGSPVRTTNWTIGTAAVATGLPGEVAAALSYHADLTDIPETQANPTPPPAIIRPAARRRGRLFLGPLTTGAMTNEGVNQDASIASSLRTNIGLAGKALADANTTASWVVYSPTDASVYLVVGGYVDDAFDTQRRRGTKAETRTLWVA